MSATTSGPIRAGAGAEVGADANATRRIRETGRGRDLLIDFYAARCCTSVLVGDLETHWIDGEPPGAVEQVGSVSGSRIVADHRLVEVLKRGRARLVETGGLLGRSLSVRLDAPEHWLAFLETPAARQIHTRPRHPLGP